MARDALGAFEHTILSVLLRQPRDAYGATLQRRIEETTGRDFSVGALYTALDRLERKGFVSSRWGEPTPERGGAPQAVLQDRGVRGGSGEADRRDACSAQSWSSCRHGSLVMSHEKR